MYGLNKSPCQTCNNRHFKCHSECEEYKGFRAKIDEVNRTRDIEQACEAYIIHKVIEYTETPKKRRKPKNVQRTNKSNS